MKVLIVHNRYRAGAPGGEDVLVDAECRLLESAGHEVIRYERSNDEINQSKAQEMLAVALQVRRSSQTDRELSALVRLHRPDVAHCHNLFPLITASAYDVFSREKIPVVQTLHNYRLSCAAAIHYRDGRECRDCRSRNPWPAVLHGCYSHSRLATALVASMIWRNHRDGTIRRKVDRYLVLSEFARRWLVSQGVDNSIIATRANWVDAPTEAVSHTGNYFVFSGRLSEEKGLRVLFDAWSRLKDVPLKIVGDGPLRAELEQRVRTDKLPIEFVGTLPRSEALSIVRSAQGLVLPSLWYEGMPLVILEAWAMGVPVVCSRIGGLVEMMGNEERGLSFAAGDEEALAGAVRRLIVDRGLVESIRQRARAAYLRRHTPDEGLSSLLAVYESCCLRSGDA